VAAGQKPVSRGQKDVRARGDMNPLRRRGWRLACVEMCRFRASISSRSALPAEQSANSWQRPHSASLVVLEWSQSHERNQEAVLVIL